MNIELINLWLTKMNPYLQPPGCRHFYVESIVNPVNSCIEIGIVDEHRFAFLYWSRYKLEYESKGLEQPIFLSLDYHDDVGVKADFSEEELSSLNIRNRNEISLFCWSRLRSLNDGQILPALYLDFFKDVYIFNTIDSSRGNFSFVDCQNNSHNIKYFSKLDELINDLAKTNRPIYLDIDLDFFTFYPDISEILGSAKISDIDEIKSLINLKSPLMKLILQKLVGITIALEPEHCGGYKNSNFIFNILNEEFFNNTLSTDNCKWNIE